MDALHERLACRWLLRCGLGLWLLAAFAAVWEALAQQAPDSPFRLGLLSGPIGQLRAHAFALGGGLLAGAWLWPRLYPPGKGRLSLGALCVGALGSTLALVYAASQGMVGVQVLDPRNDARWLVIARACAHGLLIMALADAFWRACRRRPS